MKINKCSFIYALALFPAIDACAAENTNDIKFDLRGSSRFTDNALRKPTDEIDERQDEYSAGVAANYANDWTNLKTNYDASWFTFEQGSQKDRNLLQGETELTFGNSYEPISLLLAHSRRSILNKADAIDLVSNRDERDVLTAEPEVRWKLNESDILALSASYSHVSYKFDGANDSNIQGLNLAWQLGISKVDTVVFSAEQSSVSFDGAPASDYKHQNINIKYAVKLSNLSYDISLGGNRAVLESESNNITRPSFDISVSYDTGFNTFKLIANKKITDTSMGDGNNNGLGMSPGDSLGQGIHLIDLTRAELSWATEAVCERCKLNVSAFERSQKYQNSNQSYTETGAGAGFNYRLTKAASFYLNVSRSRRDFDPTSQHVDFTTGRASFGFMYKFTNDLLLNIYRFQEKRDSDVFAETYMEHYTGLSLSYSF
jgi:hypothetical protein